MITIISPTTTMNFEKNINLEKSLKPIFIDDANYLIDLLKSLDINDISKLMNLSEDLTKLNFERYKSYSNPNNPKSQSILAFDGEVFSCMDISDFDNSDFNFTNNHLRILSGLYGILSPFDMVEPYRLEMKAKLKNKQGNDLYKFWKEKITNNIISELKKQTNPTLVNLASSEYLKCIDLKSIRKHYKFIDIVFKEYNKATDSYRVIGLYSKKARGYMVRYITKNRIDDIDSLKKFNVDGYSYNSVLSNDETIVFTR